MRRNLTMGKKSATARPFIVALMLAAVSLGGCATNPPPLAAPAATGLSAYKLGPGDRLRITVFGEATLTGEYQVTDDGTVAFPLIGNVPAAHGSLVALRDAIQAQLAGGYLKDPRVSVEVLAYRPYYILGEVNKPGQYPFVVGLRLDQAVAAAGGFTYRANTGKVFLRRADDDGEKTVDLRRQSVTILPGDTLRIGERYF
jgi:polysaccharide export outer membrane protein